MQGQERNSEIRPIPDKQCSLVSSETVPVTTGRVIGQAGALPQNVTDSKQAEAALRRLNEELEQMVEARTQELSAANEELTAMNGNGDRVPERKRGGAACPGEAVSCSVQFVALLKRSKRRPDSVDPARRASVDRRACRLRWPL